MKRALAVATLGVGLLSGSGVALAPPADALPYGCEEIPWGPFGSQRRQICDGPLAADGSWMRQRIIGIPAGYRQASSQCYGGAVVNGFSWGYSNCINTPGGLFAQVTISNDTYRVFPNNVVPGEPGYLG